MIVGLPSPEVERYVSRRELAQIMGVSVDTVKRLEKKGMPRVKFGQRTVRYRASVAVAWARAHGSG